MPPRTPPSNTPYHRLLRELRKQIEVGVTKFRRETDQQKVLMHWNNGRSITRCFLAGDLPMTREEIYDHLQEDLNINKRTLQQGVQFFGVYPKLDRKLPLTWSHYRCLMTLTPAERRRWELRIVKKDMPAKEFVNLLRESKHVDPAGAGPIRKEKDIQRGTLYAYRIVKMNTIQDRPDGFMVDCGFCNRIEPPPAKGKVDNTHIVESVKAKGQYSLVISKKTKDDIFTYKAVVARVIDGDSLLVNVDVGFGIWREERLRLRGIDVPELGTAQGNLARRFLENELADCPFAVVKTYKSDKYDRYLVDVFYKPNASDAQDVADSGALLNAAILKKGLAKVW